MYHVEKSKFEDIFNKFYENKNQKSILETWKCFMLKGPIIVTLKISNKLKNRRLCRRLLQQRDYSGYFNRILWTVV